MGSHETHSSFWCDPSHLNQLIPGLLSELLLYAEEALFSFKPVDASHWFNHTNIRFNPY